MEKSWQDVLDTFHYGIYLITIAADGGYNGMIASWITQCSYEPPLIAVAVRKNRLTHSQIKITGRFGVNVLPEESKGIVNRFKIPDWKKKFDDIDYSISKVGNPIIKDALGFLDCTVEKAIELGDHTLFISRITGGDMIRSGHVLTTDQYNGVYRGDK